MREQRCLVPYTSLALATLVLCTALLASLSNSMWYRKLIAERCLAALPAKRGTYKSLNKYRMVLELAKLIRFMPGDIVEAGVAAGGGILPVLFFLACTGDLRGRRVHLFDTWEGLPASNATQDAGFQVGHFLNPWEAFLGTLEYYGEAYGRTSWAKLRCLLPHGPLSWERAQQHLHVHRGLFEKTMQPALASKLVALLMCDGDLYTSSLGCLQAAGNATRRGSWFYMDDYYAFLGNYHAVKDYRRAVESAHPGGMYYSSITLVPQKGPFRLLPEDTQHCVPPKDNNPTDTEGHGRCGGEMVEAAIWQQLAE